MLIGAAARLPFLLLLHPARAFVFPSSPSLAHHPSLSPSPLSRPLSPPPIAPHVLSGIVAPVAAVAAAAIDRAVADDAVRLVHAALDTAAAQAGVFILLAGQAAEGPGTGAPLDLARARHAAETAEAEKKTRRGRLAAVVVVVRLVRKLTDEDGIDGSVLSVSSR